MTKQQRINKFITDFVEFIEQYYSSQITSISLEEKEGCVVGTIQGKQESTIEILTEDSEVIVCFGESHWHIDDYNDPIDYENIYENTIESVIEILQGKLGTYSCWRNGRTIGGASFVVSTDSEIVNEIKATDIFKTSTEIRIKKWGVELRSIEI